MSEPLTPIDIVIIAGGAGSLLAEITAGITGRIDVMPLAIFAMLSCLATSLVISNL